MDERTWTKTKAEAQRVTYLAVCDARERSPRTVWIIDLSDPPPDAPDDDADEDN